jgi:hypothetical protein
MIESRERFRTTSPQLTTQDVTTGQGSWIASLSGYDDLLQRFLGELIEALDDLDRTIAAWRRHS